MKKLSKTVMISSAVLNGLPGLLLTFLPTETGHFLGSASQAGPDVLAFQLLEAAMIGFAMLNYMGGNAILGGIYGKPILLGNMIFHFIAGLELARYAFDSGEWMTYSILSVFYILLAIGFTKLNFTSAA